MYIYIQTYKYIYRRTYLHKFNIFLQESGVKIPISHKILEKLFIFLFFFLILLLL